MSGDADPTGVDRGAAIRFELLVQQRGNHPSDVVGSLAAGAQVDLAPLFVGLERDHFAERVADVVGGRHDEAVAREVGHQERRLLPQAGVAVGEDHERERRVGNRREVRGRAMGEAEGVFAVVTLAHAVAGRIPDLGRQRPLRIDRILDGRDPGLDHADRMRAAQARVVLGHAECVAIAEDGAHPSRAQRASVLGQRIDQHDPMQRGRLAGLDAPLVEIGDLREEAPIALRIGIEVRGKPGVEEGSDQEAEARGQARAEARPQGFEEPVRDAARGALNAADQPGRAAPRRDARHIARGAETRSDRPRREPHRVPRRG